MYSRAIKETFNQRKEEIDEFLELIKKTEENSTNEIFSLRVRTSLKSSLLLLLYNLVESVVSVTMEAIHENICSKELTYSQLNIELQELLLAYYLKVIDRERSDHMRKAKHIREMISLSINNKKFDIKYQDMIKFYPLYSGNLDAKTIKKTLAKYGIHFILESSELKTIKEKRNKLAHGEESFEECGRNMSYAQLIVLKEKSYEFISKMIDTVQSYIKNENFKLSQPEP